MDEITRRYLEIVERISRYPVTDPAARARMLAEIEVQDRRDRAAASRDSTQFDLDAVLL